MELNYDKILISLFDRSGNWSAEYEKAGWIVYRVDLKDGIDIMTWDYKSIKTWGKHIERQRVVCGVIAAVPCTEFALTGAASFAKKDQDGTTDEAVKLAKKALEIISYFGLDHWGYFAGDYSDGDTPFFWAIENPMTRLHKLVPEVGQIKFKFSPNEFAQYSDNPEANQYSKQTWLFGEFKAPEKKPLPSLISGLKWKDSKRGTREQKAQQRSVTPDGFSKAFYLANN